MKNIKRAVFYFILIFLIGFLIFNLFYKNLNTPTKFPEIYDGIGGSNVSIENCRYCEKDSDCTHTSYRINNCCYDCSNPVNVKCIDSIQAWRQNNCKKSEEYYNENCAMLECMLPGRVLCVKNQCENVNRKG